jgi:transposase
MEIPRCRERVIQLVEEGKSGREIADIVGVSRQRVYDLCRVYKLPLVKKRGVPNQERVSALHSEGMSDREMAAAIGIHKLSVARIRKELGLSPNKASRRGAPPRLTLDEVRAVIVKPVTMREQAAELGISMSTLQKYRLKIQIEDLNK